MTPQLSKAWLPQLASSDTAWRLAPLQPRDVKDVGVLLGRAFADDPVVAYYFPEPDGRLRLCTSLMTVATSLSSTYGQGFSLSDEGEFRAAALLLPPSRMDFPIGAIVRELATKPLLWRPKAIWRYFGVADSVESHRPPGPVWTLMTLGVDPRHQRRGLGRDLLRLLLQLIPPRESVFLETYDSLNLGFYSQHGFELDQAFMTHGGRGPQCWTMIRRGALKTLNC